MLPSEKDSRQNQDLVIQSVRELMGGKYVDPEKFAKEPTSAEAEALRLLDYNTGKFAQNYVNEQENPDPRVAKAMGGFSQEKFREAIQSVEEPTPEAAKQKREGLLEASTFLPGVGGVIDVGKSTVDFLGGRGGLANIGIAAASFLPGGKIATTALRQGKALTKTAREELRKKYELPKSQRQKRVPEVQQAAEDLYNKKITKAEYDNIVRDKQPIVPIKEMPEVPDLDRIEAVLDESKVKTGIVGKTLDGSSLQGKRVASRLDIPAYDNYDTWVVSLHDGTKRNGIAIGYGQSAVLKNVDFHSYEKASLNIARGKSKATIARIYGDYDDVPVETVYNKVKKELTNPNSEYVQVGMNPFRHSYFYDKAKGTPILKADEILQIGPLVLAKTPIYGKAADFSFKEGGMVNMQNGGILGGDLPPEAIANGNVIQGAPVGEVAVPGGGGPVDDGVPTQLPEGTFVLNAASVEYHGTKHINDLIKKSIRNLVKKGVQITGEDLNPDDDVPVAISNGEYIIPPEVSRDIGIKKLEDMNERGLEYRKKIEEQEKQKVAAQDEAMNSFVGAPIQSEQQMPMQDGGEASPPDEAMPQVPKTPEDTSGLTEGQKAVIEAEMLKRRLQQEFFNRETERQRRMMEEDERNRGMIFNPKTNGYDLMVQAQPTPTPFVDTLRRISPDNLDKPRRIMGDPNNPSVPVRQAAIGGQILPQVQSTLAGAGIGANAFPASPQEAFLNTPITGSVLQNLGNAVPLGAMQQPQQQAGFMQPMAQKKNPEIARFSFADGDIVPQQLSDVTEEERDKVAAYELTGGNVEIWKKVKAGTYGEDLHTYGLNPEYDLKNKKLMEQKNIKKYIRYKTYDAKTNQLLTYLDHTGNRTVLGVNIEALPKGHKFKNAEVNKPFGIEEVSTEQDKIYDRAVEQAATFSKKYDIQNPKAKRFVRDVYFNFGMGKEGGKGGFMNKMPGAFKALTQKDYPILALELQYKNPFSSSKQETSYFRPGTNINVRALDHVNMLKSIIPVPKTKPTQ